METFAQRIRRLRLKRNLTMREVADRVGISVTTYRDWEYGRQIRGEPYPRLAQALVVSLTELMTGAPTAPGEVLAELDELEARIRAIRQRLLDL